MPSSSGSPAQFGPRVLRAPKALDQVRRELDEYFAGRRQRSTSSSTFARTPAFNRQVLEELAGSSTDTRRPTERLPRRSATRAPRGPSAPS